jgi:tetratricopeptide (TPR) repeat protein
MSTPVKVIVLSVAFTATMSSSSSGQLDEEYWGGLSAWGREDYAEAIRLLTKVVERNPKHIDALLFRAAAHGRLGEFDEAMADYNNAVQIDPKFGPAFALRGAAWHDKGEFEKALDDFDEAIRFDPESVDALNSKAWLRATCVNDKYRDGEKAVVDATKVCEVTEWQDPYCLDTLAASYAETGQFEKAVEWQKKAIELVPKDDDFPTRLALYQAKKPYREEPRKK